MPLVTYTDLQREVRLLAADSSANDFDEVVRVAIDSCENEINGGFVVEQLGVAHAGLRVPEMVVRDVLTFNKTFETLPADFLEMISAAWVDGDRERPMEQVPNDGIGDVAHYARRNGFTPYRRYFAIQGGQMRLAPPPGDGDELSVRIVFYGRVPPVSDPSPCYDVLLRYPNVYRYGSLRHVAMWQGDDANLAKWTLAFQSAIRGANKASLNR